MKTTLTLAAAALLLGSSISAHAAQAIHSPTIFGSNLQDRAQCIVRNTGTPPIPVTITIFTESGSAVATSTCSGSITPGHNCSAFANIANGVAYACSATAGGSAKALRGSLILYDTVDPGDFEPIRSGELR